MSLRLLSNILSLLCLPSLFSIIRGAVAADTLKGLVTCMNNEDCLGANRMCSHADKKTEGRCTCQQGYIPMPKNKFACYEEVPRVTCVNDEDCALNEVCMSWEYDPDNDLARKLADNFQNTGIEIQGLHKLCIDTWIISKTFNNHLESLDPDGPRTGGGLRSGVSRMDHDHEYYFGGRRPPRVHQQYIGFAEDMMLIVFLVCILATLVTVHRATCYRQFQEARRNTPLRHILPITEDRPPPYINREPESVDGMAEVVCSNPGPKHHSDSPPPTYEEALYRNIVQLSTMDGDQGAVPPPEGQDSNVPAVGPSRDLVGVPSVEQSMDLCGVPTINQSNNPPVNQQQDPQSHNQKSKNPQSEDPQSPDKHTGSSTQDTQAISKPANSSLQEDLVTSSTGEEGRRVQNEDNLQAAEENFTLKEENLPDNLVSNKETFLLMKDISLGKENKSLGKKKNLTTNENNLVKTEDSFELTDQYHWSEATANTSNVASVETVIFHGEDQMSHSQSFKTKKYTLLRSGDMGLEIETEAPCSNPSSLDSLLPHCVDETNTVLTKCEDSTNVTLTTSEAVEIKTGSKTVEDVTKPSVIRA